MTERPTGVVEFPGSRLSALGSAGFDGKRVTVMGLGTRGGGVGVARFLAARGAVVTVTDGKAADDLAQPIGELAGLPIRYVLGGHAERDFTPAGADLIVRNPGVRRTSPYLQLARETGVPVEMEMTIFLRLCPAPIVGITGTKGKTTTANLCAAMLAAWDRRTVLAGNMGVSALAQLAHITAETPVVIEISNWQLEGLAEHRLAPPIAVLTNIYEDHLDTYDDFAEYAATKRSIAWHQGSEDVLVVNADNPQAWQAARETRAKVIPFGVGDRRGDGMWGDWEQFILRRAGESVRVAFPAAWPHRRGVDRLENVLAAAAAALRRGAPADCVVQGLLRCGGVQDRDELVAEIGGVKFVNDTAATAPVAAIAALRRYGEAPVV
jgi:UDP-N-acetylmuramoylalanine--D-glutamate ligase